MLELNRLSKEKIYSPVAGLLAATLHDPEAGPHPVLRFETRAGFSPPRDRKSCKILFGPACGAACCSAALLHRDGSGETNFLFSPSRIPFAGRGVGTCEAHRKNGLSRPTERGRHNPSLYPVRQLPGNLFVFSAFHQIWNKALFFLDDGSVRRPSVRGRQRNSAREDSGLPKSGHYA